MKNIKLKKKKLLTRVFQQGDLKLALFYARYRLRKYYVAVLSDEYVEMEKTKKRILLGDFKQALISNSLSEILVMAEMIWSVERNLEKVKGWENYVGLMG